MQPNATNQLVPRWSESLGKLSHWERSGVMCRVSCTAGPMHIELTAAWALESGFTRIGSQGWDLHFGSELSELWLSSCFYRNINILFLHWNRWINFWMAHIKHLLRLYSLRTGSACWDKFSEFQEEHLQSFFLTKTLQNGLWSSC